MIGAAERWPGGAGTFRRPGSPDGRQDVSVRPGAGTARGGRAETANPRILYFGYGLKTPSVDHYAAVDGDLSGRRPAMTPMQFG